MPAAKSRRRRQLPKGPLTIREARDSLSIMVESLSKQRKPSETLADAAIQIGRGRKHEVVLMSQLDAATFDQRVEELEDQLEDLSMALFIQDRLANTSGERLTTAEFLQGSGMESYLDRLAG